MNKIEFKKSILSALEQAYNKFNQNKNLLGICLHTSEGYSDLGIRGITNELSDKLFITDEWNLEFDYSSLEAANNYLYDLYDQGIENEEEKPNWYEEYKQFFIESCLESLKSFKDKNEPKLFLIIGVSDSLIPYTQGTSWSSELNEEQIHQRYYEFSQTVIKNGYY